MEKTKLRVLVACEMSGARWRCFPSCEDQGREGGA